MIHASPTPKAPEGDWSPRREVRNAKLGAQGAPHPPSAAQIPKDRIAPAHDRTKYYDTPSAASSAKWLEDQTGKILYSVKAGDTKLPDSTTGVETFELKEVSKSKSSFQNGIREARAQSQNVVLDARETGLAPDEAERYLRGALGMYGKQLKSVIVILRDQHLHWKA